jgi:hypothetical protein
MASSTDPCLDLMPTTRLTPSCAWHVCVVHARRVLCSEAALSGLPIAVQPLPPRQPAAGSSGGAGAGSSAAAAGGGGGRKRGRPRSFGAAGAEHDGDDDGDDDGGAAAGYRGNQCVYRGVISSAQGCVASLAACCLGALRRAPRATPDCATPACLCVSVCLCLCVLSVSVLVSVRVCTPPRTRARSWSAISRRERYRKRCTEAGEQPSHDADADLLPGALRACACACSRASAAGAHTRARAHAHAHSGCEVHGGCWAALCACRDPTQSPPRRRRRPCNAARRCAGPHHAGARGQPSHQPSRWGRTRGCLSLAAAGCC